MLGEHGCQRAGTGPWLSQLHGLGGRLPLRTWLLPLPRGSAARQSSAPVSRLRATSAISQVRAGYQMVWLV